MATNNKNLAQLLENPQEFIDAARKVRENYGEDDDLDNSLTDDDSKYAGKLADNTAALGDKRKAGGIFCSECEDQPGSLFCQQCADDFCDVCFQALHRKGKRKAHLVKKNPGVGEVSSASNVAAPSVVNGKSAPLSFTERIRKISTRSAGLPATESEPAAAGPASDESFVDAETYMEIDAKTKQEQITYRETETFRDRAKWIPVRLSLAERKLLRLLEAALNVSEYTDKIDVVSYRSNRTHRMVAQIKDLCAILCGLVVAADYSVGQELIKDKDYKFNEAFFRRVFEIGRRHKVMNPEKMRTTYGKLIYLLMDAVSSEVSEMLEFSCVSELHTVADVLAKKNADAMLDDPLMYSATQEIIPDNKGRGTIQKEIKTKERAIETLAKKYSNDQISDDDVRTMLYSIGDNSSFLRGNRDPIDKMILLLKTHFTPQDSSSSLAISSGRSGARLTHNHERQYYYVLQSMTLWREINHNMFKLWCLSEQDLLDQNCEYRLRDTGQGLNRVQSCPRVSKEIHRMLGEVMRNVGQNNWVGSSVVHLGDTNVPNALVFIDKYTQIARILNPIVLCIEKIDTELEKNAEISRYIQKAFGGVKELKLEILGDFFRHGFDGSGADNFFDAGSCIDGRLTSAWNWCHQIEKKRYFPVFLLTGFIGFDGEF